MIITAGADISQETANKIMEVVIHNVLSDCA